MLTPLNFADIFLFLLSARKQTVRVLRPTMDSHKSFSFQSYFFKQHVTRLSARWQASLGLRAASRQFAQQKHLIHRLFRNGEQISS